MYLHNVAGTQTPSFRGWSDDHQQNILDLKPREFFCHLDPLVKASYQVWLINWAKEVSDGIVYIVNIVERFHTYSMVCQRYQKNFYGGPSWQLGDAAIWKHSSYFQYQLIPVRYFSSGFMQYILVLQLYS